MCRIITNANTNTQVLVIDAVFWIGRNETFTEYFTKLHSDKMLLRVSCTCQEDKEGKVLNKIGSEFPMKNDSDFL